MFCCIKRKTQRFDRTNPRPIPRNQDYDHQPPVSRNNACHSASPGTSGSVPTLMVQASFPSMLPQNAPRSIPRPQDHDHRVSVSLSSACYSAPQKTMMVQASLPAVVPKAKPGLKWSGLVEAFRFPFKKRPKTGGETSPAASPLDTRAKLPEAEKRKNSSKVLQQREKNLLKEKIVALQNGWKLSQMKIRQQDVLLEQQKAYISRLKYELKKSAIRERQGQVCLRKAQEEYDRRLRQIQRPILVVNQFVATAQGVGNSTITTYRTETSFWTFPASDTHLLWNLYQEFKRSRTGFDVRPEHPVVSSPGPFPSGLWNPALPPAGEQFQLAPFRPLKPIRCELLEVTSRLLLQAYMRERVALIPASFLKPLTGKFLEIKSGSSGNKAHDFVGPVEAGDIDVEDKNHGPRTKNLVNAFHDGSSLAKWQDKMPRYNAWGWKLSTLTEEELLAEAHQIRELKEFNMYPIYAKYKLKFYRLNKSFEKSVKALDNEIMIKRAKEDPQYKVFGEEKPITRLLEHEELEYFSTKLSDYMERMKAVKTAADGLKLWFAKNLQPIIETKQDLDMVTKLFKDLRDVEEMRTNAVDGEEMNHARITKNFSNGSHAGFDFQKWQHKMPRYPRGLRFTKQTDKELLIAEARQIKELKEFNMYSTYANYKVKFYRLNKSFEKSVKSLDTQIMIKRAKEDQQFKVLGEEKTNTKMLEHGTLAKFSNMLCEYMDKMKAVKSAADSLNVWFEKNLGPIIETQEALDKVIKLFKNVRDIDENEDFQ